MPLLLDKVSSMGPTHVLRFDAWMGRARKETLQNVDKVCGKIS